MTLGIIISIVVIVITGLRLFKSDGKSKPIQEKETVHKKNDAEKFVNQLEKYGYFKYAEKSDSAILKASFIQEFDPNSELISSWDDDTNLPKDFRYYFCDGEEIFEQDGIIGLLKDLKPVFEKMNFKCEVTNHSEEWDDKKKWLNHKITINGSEYHIFKNFADYGWGEAPFRLAQILNIELQKQKIDEQIYLVNGGNDGRLVVLTKPQHDLIYKTYKDENWKPLEINEWAKVFKIDIKKFDYWNE